MFFDELKLNQKIEIPAVEIKKEDMMDFAAKYDSRPLHLDENYAKNTAFHDLIAPGVFYFMIMWNK